MNNNLKVFGEAIEVKGRKFAIVVWEEDGEKKAAEAIWDTENECWDTDFSYTAIGIDSIDVAQEGLDYEETEAAGYTFVE